MVPRANYRRQLLHAVSLFLERTPSASARARRIVRKCQQSLKAYSLNDLQWGGVITELTDSEFTTDVTYLSNLREQLESGHGQIERLYLEYDVRADLSSEETYWYEALRALSAFIYAFPHPDIEAASHQYQLMVGDVLRAQAAVSPLSVDDQTLFQIVLAEVTAVLANIQLDLSLRVYHYLTPAAPLYHKLPRIDDAPPTPPEAAQSVAWARTALEALAGNAQLFVTWQEQDHNVRFVLH